MVKSAQERIKGLKSLLPEANAIPETPGKAEMILVIKKMIRTEELGLYRKFYFENGCYFGLLLIQSQVLEKQLKNLIGSCELYLDKSDSSYERFNYKNTNLEESTLGYLVQQPLVHYIEYDKLVSHLTTFNKFRKRVIHHLTDDFDTELVELEKHIAGSYILNEYSQIENMILEASTRINYRLAEITAPHQQVIENIHKVMRSLIDLKEEEIKFKFDLP